VIGPRREFLSLLASTIVLAPAARILDAQPTREALPPLSWSCPMHPEVVDDKAGACPICKMTLMPVRLALVWSCPKHTEVTAAAAGTCKICGRPLARVTKALSWACPVHAKVDLLEPGRCPVCGRTLRTKYSRRPHGDHNPKHGGNFFMAPNNWHLEATHPAREVVRLYVYNEYSDPFIPAGFSARATLPSPAAGRGVGADVSIPFRRLGAHTLLEARIPALALPASFIVMVRFQPSDPEYQFNFDFYDYSREPVARPPAR
jgi:Heavy metal binding domain